MERQNRKHEVSDLLGYDPMSIGKFLPTFRGSVLPQWAGSVQLKESNCTVMMKAANSSEILTTVYDRHFVIFQKT
jgi:hypothetical protein